MVKMAILDAENDDLKGERYKRRRQIDDSGDKERRCSHKERQLAV